MESVHNPFKKFLCSDCGSSYKSQSALIDHRKRTHLKLKPHVCTICNKGFYYNRSLQEHLRTHTGEKPYQCQVILSTLLILTYRTWEHGIWPTLRVGIWPTLRVGIWPTLRVGIWPTWGLESDLPFPGVRNLTYPLLIWGRNLTYPLLGWGRNPTYPPGLGSESDLPSWAGVGIWPTLSWAGGRNLTYLSVLQLTDRGPVRLLHLSENLRFSP